MENTEIITEPNPRHMGATEQALLDMGNDFKEVMAAKDKKLKFYEWRMEQADRKLRDIKDDCIRIQTILDLFIDKRYKNELDKLRHYTHSINNTSDELREELDSSSEDYTDFHLYLEDLLD